MNNNITYQADDSRPVDSFSHDVGQVAHDKYNQRFNDSGVTGVLEEQCREPSNDDSNALRSSKSALLATGAIGDLSPSSKCNLNTGHPKFGFI